MLRRQLNNCPKVIAIAKASPQEKEFYPKQLKENKAEIPQNKYPLSNFEVELKDFLQYKREVF